MNAPDYASPPVILVIDDEATIREIVADILRMEGYSVITAAHGLTALEQVRAEPQRFALVLLDMIMPEINGEMMVRRLHEINPAIKIIICSGYTEQRLRNGFGTDEIAAFLPKPFQVHQLLTQVQQALAFPSHR